MASMGVDAGVEYAKTGKKVSGYTDTGVTLIAAKPVAGVDSKDVKIGTDAVLGQEVIAVTVYHGPRIAGVPTAPRRHGATACRPAKAIAWTPSRSKLPPIGPARALHRAGRSPACSSPRTTERFFSGAEPVADPAAGDGRRRHRDRPDADHPDRRHRPVVRHGDGARQHRDDQVRRRTSACRRLSPILCGIARHGAVRAAQRAAGHAHQAAAVHRHARHLQHRVRDHAAVLQRADGDRPARGDDLARQHLRGRRRRRSPTARC